MRPISALLTFFLLGSCGMTFGCARSYFAYDNCHINCDYCRPSPPPFSQYSEQVCHSSAVDGVLYGPPPMDNEGQMALSEFDQEVGGK